MGVEVKGLRSGYESNVESYSIVEDATTLDPSSMSGGVGSLSLTAQDYPEASWLLGDTLDLSDTGRGKFQGFVRQADGNSQGSLSITSDSILGLLNVTRTINTYNGTLAGAVQHVMTSMDIDNTVSVESSIASRSVVLHGFYDNVWDNLRRFLTAQQVELSLVFNTIVVRPVRNNEAYPERMTDEGWSVASTGATRTVEVKYYPTTFGGQVEVYPVVGQEPPTLTVDANEVVTTDIQLNAAVVSVNQPVHIATVENRPYPGTNGVYAVAGSDGLPVTPAQWAAQGGYVWVETTNDPRVIRVTVRGMSDESLQPYKIAMTAGTSSYYPALRITGTSSVWREESIVLYTGAASNVTADESSPVIENYYIQTLDQAFKVGVQAAKTHSGVVSSLSGAATDLNRPGGNSEGEHWTIGDFNAEQTPGFTIAGFNLTWAGKTIEDFNEAMAAKVALLFGNQSFGNAVGSRLIGADANFRIDSVTTTPEALTFSASSDTTVQDFNERQYTKNIGDLNRQWSGRIMGEFATKPLLGGILPWQL